jgi:hypothetical protein
MGKKLPVPSEPPTTKREATTVGEQEPSSLPHRAWVVDDGRLRALRRVLDMPGPRAPPWLPDRQAPTPGAGMKPPSPTPFGIVEGAYGLVALLEQPISVAWTLSRVAQHERDPGPRVQIGKRLGRVHSLTPGGPRPRGPTAG